jgi:hypothetical protein
MSFLDLDRLARTPLATDPCAYVVVPGFVRAETLPAIRASYPRIDRPGSFPLRELAYGERFAAFVAELEGPAFRQTIEAKFGVDLAGRPSIVTVRGQCGERDGNIHTDSKSKIISVLIYLNEPWEPAGGRLRLLRSEHNLEDYAVEVPPEGGLMLAFRRSSHSFHGHQLFIGPRKVVQFNWVTGSGHVAWDLLRHRLSAWFKRAA